MSLLKKNGKQVRKKSTKKKRQEIAENYTTFTDTKQIKIHIKDTPGN